MDGLDCSLLLLRHDLLHRKAAQQDRRAGVHAPVKEFRPQAQAVPDRGVQEGDLPMEVPLESAVVPDGPTAGREQPARRVLHKEDAEHLRHHNTDFNISVLFAGQIFGEKPRLFNIYSAGNFIEASQETPYFQIGETKYGKPILDRVINYKCGLEDALKCVLISFDSTIRSNVSVDLPVDVLVYRNDKLSIDYNHRVAKDDPYFLAVRKHWGEGLRKVFAEIPNPDWC